MIQRSLFARVKKHLDNKEITMIVGPRQSGKTTLLRQLEAGLKQENKKTLFFNLDIEADKQFFTSQDNFLQRINLEFGKNPGMVFIDEIQRKENAGLFLKGIFDMNLAYKFVVSGSGSLELKEKIHESLAGRKRIFELPPITFVEFFNYSTQYKFASGIGSYMQTDEILRKNLLNQYLRFGGYPKVILSDMLDEKRAVIAEIFQSYIEKDITYLLKIKKTNTFVDLVKILSFQIGQIVNVSELSSTLGASAETINNFLWYLQKTFIIRKVTPYFKNPRKELIKNPVYYFHDLGLRNFTAGLFGSEIRHENSGFLFQNFIYNILHEKLENTSSTLNFWRTKDGAEVDFVLNRGKDIIPIEVKFSDLKESKIQKSMHSFINDYKPSVGYVINLSFSSEINIGKTKIIFLPYYKLPEENFS